MSSGMLIELLAGCAGLVSGFAAAWLAAISSRKLGANGYWRRIVAVGRSLLSSEDQNHFFRQYVELWPMLSMLVVKKLAIAMAALLPVLLAFACLTPLANGIWESHAHGVEFAPPQRLAVELSGRTQSLDEYNCTLQRGFGLEGPAVISIHEGRIHCTKLMRKQAYAPNWSQRLMLRLLGFEMLDLECPLQVDVPLLLVRPSWDDNNVLWPYLSDWEFDFFVAVCVASLAGMLAARSRA